MSKSRHASSEFLDFPEGSNVTGPVSPVRVALDEEGIPRQLPVTEWLDGLPMIDSRGFQAILRFCRADGSVVFGPTGRSLSRLRRLDQVAERLADPSLAAVVARWLPSSRAAVYGLVTPPLPSYCSRDRPLAIFRADWSPRGDVLAVDHRQIGPESQLEAGSKGQVWLGPSWTSSRLEGRVSSPRQTSSTSTAFAQSLEWSFKAGTTRVTRSVTLLRGKSMALLGQQVDGPMEDSEIRLALPNGIEATVVAGTRSVQLRAGVGKPTARLIPLGLPGHDWPSDRGSIRVEGREVVIHQRTEGKRDWLPVLLTWNQSPTFWRSLTVAHRSRAVPADLAVAYRVAWRPTDPGVLIYRSLGPPDLRSVLGHQTSARILVGTLTRNGEVVSILKVER